MGSQQKVQDFIDKHGMEAPPEFRIMDLIAEAGEIAADANNSTDYGLERDNLNVKEDEMGDALFSLLALFNSLGVDAEQALDKTLQKYRDRIEEKGDPGSR